MVTKRGLVAISRYESQRFNGDSDFFHDSREACTAAHSPPASDSPKPCGRAYARQVTQPDGSILILPIDSGGKESSG